MTTQPELRPTSEKSLSEYVRNIKCTEHFAYNQGVISKDELPRTVVTSYLEVGTRKMVALAKNGKFFVRDRERKLELAK